MTADHHVHSQVGRRQVTAALGGFLVGLVATSAGLWWGDFTPHSTESLSNASLSSEKVDNVNSDEKQNSDATFFEDFNNSITPDAGYSTITAANTNGLPVCDVSEWKSVEAVLRRRTEPCLLRGFFPAKRVEKVLKVFSVSSLKKNSALQSAVLTTRLSKGKNHTEVMRYSKRDLGPSWEAFSNVELGLNFPTDTYDAWEFKEATMDSAIFAPDSKSSASWSSSPDAFRSIHPKGVRHVKKLFELACPFGCPDQGLYKDALLWISSRRLGQQLHFDAQANLFLHIDGPKSVILSPPAAVLRSAHLLPYQHPGHRQSQIRWTSSTTQRRSQGFTSAVGNDSNRPGPMYTHFGEQIIDLQRGDILYLPAYWGHQTMTGTSPSISLALWFFPTAVDPRGQPRINAVQERSQDYTHAKQKAASIALRGSSSGIEAWGSLRTLGELLVKKIFSNTTDPHVIFTEWLTQRWRPQFGGLGIDSSTELPSTVCYSPIKTTRIVAAAEDLARFLETLAQWHFKEHQDAILFDYVADTLDWIAAQHKVAQLSTELQAHGFSTAEAELGVVLRSFGGCDRRSVQ